MRSRKRTTTTDMVIHFVIAFGATDNDDCYYDQDHTYGDDDGDDDDDDDDYDYYDDGDGDGLMVVLTRNPSAGPACYS